MIDRVVAGIGRTLKEVPVGFKYFVEGLLDGSLGFGGEESAGASFLRREGRAWSTDKDGIIMGLLAAEMTAALSKDPGELYGDLTKKYGDFFYERIDAPANPEQKKILAALSAKDINVSDVAGEKILNVLTTAPGTKDSIGGIKVVSEGGWFAARPSGTEDVYKLYGESYRSAEHLKRIQDEAQTIVQAAFDKSNAAR
jgi:phosphoglucomutase